MRAALSGVNDPARPVDVVARIFVVVSIIPVRIVADRLGRGVTRDPIAAAVSIGWQKSSTIPSIKLRYISAHQTCYGAQRTADDDVQTGDLESFSDHPGTLSPMS